jgi:hypothetical protein
MIRWDKNMSSRKKEYSKKITTIVLFVFSSLAVGFVVFVCYEMHRLNDLSAVEHLASPIVGIPAAIVAFYMWRAKAKSKSDLEWEKTKQLTLFRKKYPEYFVKGSVGLDENNMFGDEE